MDIFCIQKGNVVDLNRFVFLRCPLFFLPEQTFLVVTCLKRATNEKKRNNKKRCNNKNAISFVLLEISFFFTHSLSFFALFSL